MQPDERALPGPVGRPDEAATRREGDPCTRRAVDAGTTAVAGWAMLGQPAGAQGDAPAPCGDPAAIRKEERAIRAVLQRLVDAWNRGDGAAFGAVFEPDADYVVFNGAHLKGRQQIATVHQQLFETVLKGTRLGGDGGGGALTIRFLRPDVALVVSTGGVLRTGQKEVSPEQNSIQTYVLVKHGERWSVAAFQNTRVQSPGPPGTPPPSGNSG